MTDQIPHSTPLASLFVAHGAPDLVLSDIPARRYLLALGPQRPTPRGIVIVSAHWCALELQMTDAIQLETIHDYHGWPSALYDLAYPAQGATWLNQRLRDALMAANYPVTVSRRPGLDHGAWVPLSLIYPEGGIPVVQLSLLRSNVPEDHFRIGQALAALHRDGILVIGSGSTVHNLARLRPEGTPPEDWARSFDDWINDRLMDRDFTSLFHFHSTAPVSRKAHPTVEHLMPLFVAMGAGRSEARVTRLHTSFSYGNLSMASYTF